MIKVFLHQHFARLKAKVAKRWLRHCDGIAAVKSVSERSPISSSNMNPRLLRRLLLGFIRDFEGEEFDKEFVALSGAHTLGRSIPDCSGWGKPETKYTKDGLGAPGGQSWTVQWLRFYNSYFKDIKEKKDKDLLVLPTDATLFEDPSFKVYAEKYAEDQEAFFKDYAEAHAKLSNLGAKFDPPEAYTWITRTRMHGRTLWAYAGHYRDYA